MFPSRRCGPAQSVHQDSRNQAGRSGDRGSHFQGRADQRHAALLARSISRCGRGVHARAGTQDRLGLKPGRSVGRVAVRQPLGQGDDGQAARQPSGSPGHRGRPIDLRRAIAISLIRNAGSALKTAGARTQRLLFASTGTKDPRAPDTLYIGALAAPNTINTIPEETLVHFADHGEVGGVLASRRRARERDAVGDCQGGRRSWRARRGPPSRGRQVVRQVVERPSEGD